MSGRQRALHPRALAGGENDGGELQHRKLLSRRGLWVKQW
jgi:hypothetical protein